MGARELISALAPRGIDLVGAAGRGVLMAGPVAFVGRAGELSRLLPTQRF